MVARKKHLALMARRKKLKSIKLGRNWVTTIEWLEEYTNQADKINKTNDAYKIVRPHRIFGTHLLAKKIIVSNIVEHGVFRLFLVQFILHLEVKFWEHLKMQKM